jgi:hypothetical protein
MILALYPVRTGYAYEFDIGNSLVCDTQEHTERLVGLYDGDMQSAIDRINAEERGPEACAVFNVVYVRGRGLETVRNRNAAFQIVPILIVGVMTSGEVHAITPTRRFALFSVKELAA